MTQPLTDKIEALKTILPLLGSHLALIPGARITPRYGDATVEPGPPTPAWVTLDCDGVCNTCDYGPQSADRCRGEAWERMACYLDRAYGMGKVRHAYDALETERPWLHRAVKLVYVEPADERSECVSVEAKIMRRRVADEGVLWMAGVIRGELTPFGEHRVPVRSEVRMRNQEIVAMRCEGKSYREIAKAIGCSKNTVAAVLAGKELRQGRAVSPSFAIKVR